MSQRDLQSSPPLPLARPRAFQTGPTQIYSDLLLGTCHRYTWGTATPNPRTQPQTQCEHIPAGPEPGSPLSHLFLRCV